MTTTNGVKSPAELVAAGKALRERVPLDAHAQWQPQAGRDPLAILHASDADRLAELLPIRYGRMLPSPFAFFRGAAAVMAADLAATPQTGLVVQACGDCDIKNFGGFATPERNLVFDINDFDETLPAPWEWDVKRLAASFVLAARANGLSDAVGQDAATAAARNYRKGIRSLAKLDPLQVWYARFGLDELVKLAPTGRDRARVERQIQKALGAPGSDAEFPKLTELIHGQVRIRDAPPLIFHPAAEQAAEFDAISAGVLKSYRSTIPDDRRVLFDRYRFVDAAIKIVGVGSVGTRCWIALLMSPANAPLFLQFKQASASVLEPYAGKSAYAHHGERVVNGQRLMQAASDIFLGWTADPNGSFYVRQLRDAKINPNVETFDAPMFKFFAGACGWNLARAHAKTGDAYTTSGYLGKSGAFDEAIAEFAKAYADRTAQDHAALVAAVKAGKIQVKME
ncbi:MAG: DUF2252 domain-containing protein [Candidatus Baltobacteraceae bacterium]